MADLNNKLEKYRKAASITLPDDKKKVLPVGINKMDFRQAMMTVVAVAVGALLYEKMMKR